MYPDHTPWTQSHLSQYRAWLEIDLDALANNVHQIRSFLTPSTALLAVVKADAYGHGAVAVAQTALRSGATWLGVATVLEGIELRQAGIEAPILLLGAANAKAEIEAIVHWRIQPTLCTIPQSQAFAAMMQSLPNPDDRVLPVHLKLDTGMSRLGTPWEQALAFVKAVAQLPGLHIASIYSHLATADEADSTTLWQQHDRFEQVLAHLEAAGLRPPCRHLANSAATFVSPTLHYDLVRVGLSLYGLYPAPHLVNPQVKLQPVLSVKARVTQVKTIAPGTGVSYGHRFIATRPTRVAVVAIGYADGVSRLLSNQLQVSVRGQWVSQIGAITMDQLMLDVTDLPGVEPGDVVTLLGATESGELRAETWAEQMGTIAWEILCSFKHRLPRILLSDRQEMKPPKKLCNKSLQNQTLRLE